MRFYEFGFAGIQEVCSEVSSLPLEFLNQMHIDWPKCPSCHTLVFENSESEEDEKVELTLTEENH